MVSIHLATKAAKGWKESALVSVEKKGILIYIDKKTAHPLRKIQMAGRQIAAMELDELALAGKEWDMESQWAFFQGWDHPKRKIELHWANHDESIAKQLDLMKKIAVWVKDVTNLPPKNIYPQTLSDQIVGFLSDIAPGQIECTMRVGDTLRDEGLVGIYNVGRGSEHPPVLLEVDYIPKGKEEADVDIALVGKGITFDSGGYSLKPSQGMLAMKADMGGAAMIAGGMALAITNGVNKRIRAYFCCAENMVSGHAYKLGDILFYLNGVSVEVVNTDAEGRLVLADGLIMAGRCGAKTIIDAATLTGAAHVALAEDFNGLFSLDHDLLHRAMDYSQEVNEPHWPLPLETWHQDKCPSAYADTANSRPQKGGGSGGASNAAGFLSRFVPNEGKGWLHIDLVGAFMDKPDTMRGPGATAMGIRTIAKLIEQE